MKFNKKIIYSAISIAAITIATVALSQEHKMMKHANMEHSSDMNHDTPIEDNTTHQESTAILSEAGTDPFAVIQEVIALLEANPDTDWSAVNIEALRLHLVEMQDMTLNVKVIQQPINFGFQAVITPTSKRALQSMSRIFSAHPSIIKEETGWDMFVTDNNGIFTIEVTSNQLQEVDKIRGLGYIGIMAYGNHHQPHHWAMASGDNPHS